MKIAVFATGWNGEYLRDMYHGLENSQKEFHDSIHLYASFGRLGSGDSFNKSEFDFFELADMEAYDGFLYPSTTIKEGDVKQRLLERIIESKKPCVSLEEEIPGFLLSESIRAKPCGRSCGILPGFMESGHLVLLTG